MKTPTASATRIIHAPADQIYRIIADYRTLHALILPKEYFLSLHVEKGGIGAGTIINFSMRILGRRQDFRSLITELQPGRLLVETDIRSETPTSFQVMPVEDPSLTRVTISTELRGRNWIEAVLARPVLQRIYRQELELLARLAEDPAAMQSISSPETKERTDKPRTRLIPPTPRSSARNGSSLASWSCQPGWTWTMPSTPG
jgi:hypothetical protein